MTFILMKAGETLCFAAQLKCIFPMHCEVSFTLAGKRPVINVLGRFIPEKRDETLKFEDLTVMVLSVKLGKVILFTNIAFVN